VTIRETVNFYLAEDPIDPDGRARTGLADEAAARLLDQLAWWARVLRQARTAEPYGERRPVRA